MKTWFVSDYHLGDSRFDLMDRPFASNEEMLDKFISEHNKLVAPDDLVYNLGDVCFKDAPGFLFHVNRFNGTKILIRGNHDRNLSDSMLKEYFTEVIPEGEGIELDVEGIPCYLNHYPTLGRQDRFNLVGHIHSSWKVQLNMFNVGVDANHFRPVSSLKVPKILEAITSFYDRDVWVADNDLNTSYNELRGKKTYYFEKIS